VVPGKLVKGTAWGQGGRADSSSRRTMGGGEKKRGGARSVKGAWSPRNKVVGTGKKQKIIKGEISEKCTAPRRAKKETGTTRGGKAPSEEDATSAERSAREKREKIRNVNAGEKNQASRGEEILNMLGGVDSNQQNAGSERSGSVGTPRRKGRGDGIIGEHRYPRNDGGSSRKSCTQDERRSICKKVH